MKSKSIIFCVFAAGGLLSGCNNPFGADSSKVEANYGYGIIPPAPAVPDLISGSVQGGVTGSGRRADISVGSPASALKLKTSANRTFFVSVQGQMISK